MDDRLAGRTVRADYRGHDEADAPVNAEMNERENGLKRDIAQIHADLKQDIERVRSEIREAELNTIKWMIGLLVAQSGLIIGVMMKLMHP